MLVHLTQYSDLLLLVTGTRGIGKTTLLRQFLGMAGDNWNTCVVDARDTLGSRTMLEHICNDLGMRSMSSDDDTRLAELQRHLGMLRENSTIPILVIDDAHELSDPALELILKLSELEDDEGKQLRIILFSEPFAEDFLSSPAIKNLQKHATHTLEIPSLNEEETEAYILHRLGLAGFTNEARLFNTSRLKKIVKNSQGIPLLINKAARELIVKQTGEASVVSSRDRLFSGIFAGNRGRAITGLGVILLAAIGLSYIILQGALSDLFIDKNETTITTLDSSSKNMLVIGKSRPIPITRSEPVKPVIPDSLLGKDNQQKLALVEKQVAESEPDGSGDMPRDVAATNEINKNKPVMLKDLEGAIITRNKTNAFPIAAPETLITDNTKAMAEPAKDTTAVVTPKPDRLARAVNPYAADIHKADRVKTKLATAAKSGKLAGTGKTDSLNQTKTEAVPAREKLATTDATPTSKKTTPLKPAAKADVVATGPATNYKQWLQKKSRKHLTLQLMGAGNRTQLQKMVRLYKLGDRAMIIPTFGSNTWYVLVYGIFATQSEARAAISGLPLAMRKERPYLRTLASIHPNDVLRSRKIASVKKLPTVTTSKAVAPTVVKTPPKPVRPAIAREAWLQSQDPSNYTIMLLGSHNEVTALKFIKDNKLQGKAAIFYTYYDHDSWYVVLYGIYPDKASAKRAASKLSRFTNASEPWVRSLASVHTDIARASPMTR
ncbi:MAG: hypothetical protein BMS9Abin26_0321 [Gammaproteobacteria bacterium]|nr:MAG: hypothetical protein BMS9Abin26_0321 [Gammaproteobacteria bacterium]